MNDRVDELLSSEGRRWREHLGPDPDLAALIRRPRPGRNHRLPALLTAAAVVAVVSIAAAVVAGYSGARNGGSPATAGASPTGGVQASCVAPVLGVERNAGPTDPGQPPSLGEVAPGQQVTVFGRWYFRGPCQDTRANGQPLPAATPVGAVRLSLTTADHRMRVLATVHPDRNASFAATLTVPADAALGPATISDGQAHVIVLDITGS
ncbi:MAG: hypothetical protein ABI301_06400 [Jatrophihabitantaceae bacterium]